MQHMTQVQMLKGACEWIFEESATLHDHIGEIALVEHRLRTLFGNALHRLIGVLHRVFGIWNAAEQITSVRRRGCDILAFRYAHKQSFDERLSGARAVTSVVVHMRH